MEQPERNYAVTTLNKEAILKRIANGEYVTRISQSLGLERSTISQAFAGAQEYKQARELGMEVQLEQSHEDIDAAGDDLNLARVREIKARRLEWKAEREFPHRWGAKQTNFNVNIDLGQELAALCERVQGQVIEGAVQQIEDSTTKDM